MQRPTFVWLLILLGALASPGGGEAAPPAIADVHHVKVYHQPGMFGGWPANHGIWSWGNEILVGFSKGYYKNQGDRHHIDREKPELHMLARSLDGGETWTIEDPGARGQLLTEGASSTASRARASPSRR